MPSVKLIPVERLSATHRDGTELWEYAVCRLPYKRTWHILWRSPTNLNRWDYFAEGFSTQGKAYHWLEDGQGAIRL